MIKIALFWIFIGIFNLLIVLYHYIIYTELRNKNKFLTKERNIQYNLIH